MGLPNPRDPECTCTEIRWDGTGIDWHGMMGACGQRRRTKIDKLVIYVFFGSPLFALRSGPGIG